LIPQTRRAAAQASPRARHRMRRGVHVEVENAFPSGLSPLFWTLAATCTGHTTPVPCAYLIAAIIDAAYSRAACTIRHCAVSHRNSHHIASTKKNRITV
jgi:hypothetical protein